jgi:hypothetical protein
VETFLAGKDERLFMEPLFIELPFGKISLSYR